MKNIKMYLGTKLVVVFCLSVVAFGCEDDFLERPPESNVTDADFFQTDDQVWASTAILYNLTWFDYIEKASYNLGDFRGGSAFDESNDRDNVEFKTTPTTLDNGAAWRAFYNTIGQANSTIANINQYAGSEVTDEVKTMAIAECRFMRALAYRHLVMNWGAVPIIENNIALLDAPLSVRRNTVSSVWEFITRDFIAAAQGLPETPIDDGRLTRWSAEGMLARTYLTRAGVGSSGGSRDQTFLDSARYYSERVIELSGASLLSSYEDLFVYPYDNNEESLFSLQWTFAPDEGGTGNASVSQITPFPDLAAQGDGWGGGKGATYWMLSLYDGFEAVGEDTLMGAPIDQRLFATFMLPGYVYDELAYGDGGAILQGFEVPDRGATLGQTQEFAYIKKYVVGRLGAAEASSQHYSNDTYMMRLAEMYLIYAEAVLGNNGSTSDVTALEYFNEIHERATGQTVTSITFNDIFEERVKEFAMESMTWYDLVRLHYYNPNLAYQIVSQQDRGLYSLENTSSGEWTIVKITWDENRSFTANSGNFRLPLPATEVSSAPNLLEEPVPYDLSE